MVMTNQEKIELLTKARDLIIKRGFAKRTFITNTGCMCTVGAIIKANNPSLTSVNMLSSYLGQEAVTELIEVMYSVMQSKKIHQVTPDAIARRLQIRNVVYDVNDMSTQDEVVDYFNKAIESLS